MRQIFLITHF